MLNPYKKINNRINNRIKKEITFITITFIILFCTIYFGLSILTKEIKESGELKTIITNIWEGPSPNKKGE